MCFFSYTSNSSPSKKTPEGMDLKILIVDDEAHIRMLLEQTLEELEEAGVHFFSAQNGEEALEVIQTELPQLVFLDVMMPKMNGMEVCRKVKLELGLSQVFIILLTAKGQELDRRKGQEVGADLYLTKPFDPDLILSKAREVLGI
jgi:two-component system alkaline phosphatase synthesis response regulator PhoP